MYQNNILKNQKGVALIVTFFILTIILAIVLNVSILLYNEIKIIRNVGNSVVAFYSADSGIEKVLYYDRKQIPEETGRGICNICNSCFSNGDCETCSIAGSGCDICSSCNIIFTSAVDSDQQNPEKTYSEDITVYQQCKISSGTINSYGYYEKVSRAIRIDSVIKTTLQIFSPGVSVQIQGPDGCKLTISTVVLDPDNVGIQSVIAGITGLGVENGDSCSPQCDDSEEYCCNYREITLTSGGDGTYSKPWTDGLAGETYNIGIMATDLAGNCLEAPVVVTCE
jgi:Tfp pilus assembly protein PilX